MILSMTRERLIAPVGHASPHPFVESSQGDAPTSSIDRREFARWLIAGAGTAGLAAGTALADDQASTPKETSDAPPHPVTVDELLLAQVVALCPGEHWDEATLVNVLNDIRGDRARGRQLSGQALKNHDEPASIFVVSGGKAVTRLVSEGL